jgi:hypothetical protein
MPLLAHLIREQILSHKEAKLLEKAALSQGCTLVHALLGLGIFTEGPLADWVAQRTGRSRLSAVEIPPVHFQQDLLLPLALMETLELIPISLEASLLVVAALDPTDRRTRAHLHFFTSHRIQMEVISRGEITQFLQRINPAYQPKTYKWEEVRATFAKERRLHAAEITGENSNFDWIEEMAAKGLFAPELTLSSSDSPSLWEEIRKAEVETHSEPASPLF